MVRRSEERAPHPLPRAHEPGHGEQHRVHVGEPHDVAAVRLDQCAEVRGAIAALVVVHLVVFGPERGERRHGDEHVAARLRDAHELAQRGVVVVDVLHHVQCRDEVPLAVGPVREVGEVGLAHGVVAAPAAELDGLVREVHPGDVAELGQVLQVDARAAAGVQDAERVPAGEGAPQQRQQDPPAADEPPVVLLEEEVLVVVGAFQRWLRGIRGDTDRIGHRPGEG